MTQQVVFELNGQDAGLVRAWLNAKNSIAAYEAQVNKLDGSQKKLNSSAKEFDQTNGMGSYVTDALAAGAAVGVLTAGLKVGLDFQNQLKQAATETVLELEKSSRLYQIQAGLNNFDASKATSKMIDIAESNAVPVKDVQATSTQLASSGYTDPENTGTTDALLKIMASSNLDASQGPEVAKSIGQFLTAFNKQKDAENLLEVGVRTRGLFAPTEVQMSDLSQFAQAAPVFASAGVSMEDTFSALAILRDAEGPEKAATHGRNVVSRMTTFASEKDKLKTLKKMGVDPKKVDLDGETLPEALQTLNAGLASLKTDAERNMAKESLFGQENIIGAEILMKGVDKFGTYGKYQHDEAGFEHGVQTAQTGPNAQLQRLEARKLRERNNYAADLTKQKLLQEEFKREDEEYGLDAQSMGVGGFFYGAGVGAKARMRDTAIWSGIVKPSDIASQENIDNVERGSKSNFSLKKLRDGMESPELRNINEQGEAEPALPILSDAVKPSEVAAQENVNKVERTEPPQPAPSSGRIKRDSDYTPEEIEARGKEVALQQREAQMRGDKEAAAALARQEQLLIELLKAARQTAAQGAPTINVTTVMPGGTAPAKPVAMAAIGK